MPSESGSVIVHAIRVKECLINVVSDPEHCFLPFIQIQSKQEGTVFKTRICPLNPLN